MGRIFALKELGIVIHAIAQNHMRRIVSYSTHPTVGPWNRCLATQLTELLNINRLVMYRGARKPDESLQLRREFEQVMSYCIRQLESESTYFQGCSVIKNPELRQLLVVIPYSQLGLFSRLECDNKCIRNDVK